MAKTKQVCIVMYHNGWGQRDHSSYPPETAVKLTVETIKWHLENVPNTFLAMDHGYDVAEAGATPVLELAFAMAHVIEVMEQSIKAGLDPNRVAAIISGHPHLSLRFYETIAKDSDFHELTEDNDSLINFMYNQWNADGSTCICCGINRAIQKFNETYQDVLCKNCSNEDEVVFYYDFNDDYSNVVLDKSGKNNNGIWYGGQDSNSGIDCLDFVEGCSKKFDGDTDYVEKSSMDDFPTTGITVS